MEDILEYTEIQGFNNEDIVPDIDPQGIIDDILGTDTEWGKTKWKKENWPTLRCF